MELNFACKENESYIKYELRKILERNQFPKFIIIKIIANLSTYIETLRKDIDGGKTIYDLFMDEWDEKELITLEDVQKRLL